MSLNDKQVEALEKATGWRLNNTIKNKIEKAINEYHYGQSLEWAQMRPAMVTQLLSKFRRSLAACEAEHRRLRDDARALDIYRLLGDAHVASVDDTTEVLDFDVWLRDFEERLCLLSETVDQVIGSLPKGDTARADAKSWFPGFVYDLADIFAEVAGEKPVVSRDRETQDYKRLPFFSFVHAVLINTLDDKFSYTGQSLGKNIETALARRDLARGSAPRQRRVASAVKKRVSARGKNLPRRAKARSTKSL